MKTLKLALFGLITTFFLGCDLNTNDNNPAVISKAMGGVLTGEIKTNRTLSADSIYLIKGFTYVSNGATLTIPAGTIIKGEKAAKSVLIVEQGGKIIADGTAQKPIVFTSDQAVGQRNYGDWGGLVIIGKAPHSLPANTLLEGGIRGSLGTLRDANDNSGILRYVRIEFAGSALATTANSKINALTFYGVGMGTVVDYVQVSYAGEDSYQWSGGTVGAKHLVALRGWDDDFETDFSYIGKVQYAVSLRDTDVADLSGSSGLVSNSNSTETVPVNIDEVVLVNPSLPLTQPVFSNVSLFAFQTTPSNLLTSKGSGAYQSGMYFSRNTAISVLNTVIVGYPEGLRLEGSTTFANVTAGKMDLRGIVFSNITQKYREGNGTTVADIIDFFETVSKGNETILLSALGLNAANFNLTAPNFLPTATSPLLTGAKFNAKSEGLEAVAYRGAFGTMDWTATWTNFNPQTTDYSK